MNTKNDHIKLLAPWFPQSRVTSFETVCIDPRNEVRTRDELLISGISEIAWTEISLLQARGTVDILWNLTPEPFSCIVAGYLQHLVDPEADILMIQLPEIVFSRIMEKGYFNRFQCIAVGRFFHGVLCTGENLDVSAVEILMSVASLALATGAILESTQNGSG